MIENRQLVLAVLFKPTFSFLVITSNLFILTACDALRVVCSRFRNVFVSCFSNHVLLNQTQKLRNNKPRYVSTTPDSHTYAVV
jgi:hypothetical protein